MKRILLTLAVAATFAAGPALAQDRSSRLLGISTLSSFEGDVDVVPLSCRNRLTAVKLRTANGPAEIERVWLTYGNGQREQVRLDESLLRGESTGWIDVSGRRRCITSIAVQGDAERRGERDRYGRYDDEFEDDYYGDEDDYYMADARYDRGRGRGRRPVDIEIYGRAW